eukprot:Colp12_sorted_trinity150504_noHs@785
MESYKGKVQCQTRLCTALLYLSRTVRFKTTGAAVLHTRVSHGMSEILRKVYEKEELSFMSTRTGTEWSPRLWMLFSTQIYPEQYQTLVISEGAQAHRHRCACRIQAWWRGLVVRRWYQKLRRAVPPKDPTLRRKFYEDKLSELTGRVLQQVARVESAVEQLLGDSAHSLAQSRQLMRQLDQLTEARLGNSTLGPGDWCLVERKAQQQSCEDCAICITPLSARPCMLLSCAHVFHEQCIDSFERYSTHGSLHHCPVCRSAYSKRALATIANGDNAGNDGAKDGSVGNHVAEDGSNGDEAGEDGSHGNDFGAKNGANNGTSGAESTTIRGGNDGAGGNSGNKTCRSLSVSSTTCPDKRKGGPGSSGSSRGRAVNTHSVNPPATKPKQLLPAKTKHSEARIATGPPTRARPEVSAIEITTGGKHSLAKPAAVMTKAAPGPVPGAAVRPAASNIRTRQPVKGPVVANTVNTSKLMASRNN